MSAEQSKARPAHTGADLQFLAAGQVNPYYLAYAIDTGSGAPADAFRRDGGNHLFAGWNDARWAEQAKLEGVSRDVVSVLQGSVERHLDHLAVFLGVKLTAALAKAGA